MKTKASVFGLLLGIAAILPLGAKAGGNTYNGTGSWDFTTPSTTSFSSSVYDSTAIVVNITSEQYVYNCTSPGGGSASASNQPADEYEVIQVVSYGVPGAFATTVVSW
jgi:hypothetical protein